MDSLKIKTFYSVILNVNMTCHAYLHEEIHRTEILLMMGNSMLPNHSLYENLSKIDPEVALCNRICFTLAGYTKLRFQISLEYVVASNALLPGLVEKCMLL